MKMRKFTVGNRKTNGRLVNNRGLVASPEECMKYYLEQVGIVMRDKKLQTNAMFLSPLVSDMRYAIGSISIMEKKSIIRIIESLSKSMPLEMSAVLLSESLTNDSGRFGDRVYDGRRGLLSTMTIKDAVTLKELEPNISDEDMANLIPAYIGNFLTPMLDNLATNANADEDYMVDLLILLRDRQLSPYVYLTSVAPILFDNKDKFDNFEVAVTNFVKEQSYATSQEIIESMTGSVMTAMKDLLEDGGEILQVVDTITKHVEEESKKLSNNNFWSNVKILDIGIFVDSITPKLNKTFDNKADLYEHGYVILTTTLLMVRHLLEDEDGKRNTDVLRSILKLENNM